MSCRKNSRWTQYTHTKRLTVPLQKRSSSRRRWRRWWQARNSGLSDTLLCFALHPGRDHAIFPKRIPKPFNSLAEPPSLIHAVGG